MNHTFLINSVVFNQLLKPFYEVCITLGQEVPQLLFRLEDNTLKVEPHNTEPYKIVHLVRTEAQILHLEKPQEFLFMLEPKFGQTRVYEITRLMSEQTIEITLQRDFEKFGEVMIFNYRGSNSYFTEQLEHLDEIVRPAA